MLIIKYLDNKWTVSVYPAELVDTDNFNSIKKNMN